MASLVKTRLGKAVKALRVMSRLCDVRLGKVRQSRRCKFWQGEFWRGESVTARNTNYLERRHNASIYKQIFISQGI